MSASGRRILHVYKDYYPPVHGGIEKTVAALARGARDEGFEVSVLVANPGGGRTREEESDGISIVRVKEWGRFQSAPVCPTFPLWFGRLGRKADILHFHFPNPTGEISSLLSDVGKINLVTYYSDVVRQRMSLRCYRPFVKAFLRRADLICPLTETYIQGSQFLRPLAYKCWPIPLGIDVAEFEKAPPNEEIEQIHNRYGKKIIIFLGVFRHYKGIRELIRAASQLRDATLLMIGEGMLFRTAEGYAREMSPDGRIFLLGRLSDEEVRKYLHACSFLVLPSTNRAEAFGLVLLEAMACGKPVISTALGTGTDFINLHGRTGLTVAPGNVEALRSAMEVLLDDAELRERLGREARRRVFENFTKQHMIRSYREVYELLLGNLQPSPA